MQKQFQNASLVSRCVGSIIDGIVGGICICILYPLWKDGIREGRSVGSGAMGIKVVKMNTGQPATCVDSIIRNCALGISCGIGYLCCLFNSENRHFGDLVAGTISVEDS